MFGVSWHVDASFGISALEDPGRVTSENRAGRLIDLMEFSKMTYNRKGRAFNGQASGRSNAQSRQSTAGNGSNDTSNWIDYTWFGPMVDEMLVGRYCNRDYFRQIQEVCDSMLGDAAENLGTQTYPAPAQVADYLVQNTTNSICKFVSNIQTL